MPWPDDGLWPDDDHTPDTPIVQGASDEDLWFSCGVHEDPLLYVLAMYRTGQIERPTSLPEPLRVPQQAFVQMMGT